MRLRNYVPTPLMEYIKLLRARHRYPHCQINSPFIAANVTLGHACIIARNVELAAQVSIGSYSYVNAGTVIASGSVGKFCSIGYSCQIGMPTHPINYLSTSPRTYGMRNIFEVPAFWEDYPEPPQIGNDVWVGSHALILQGVSISDGAIVAGGAVVTKNVPPYAIVAGVPAKIMRYRFDDSSIKQLLEWKWWDLPANELQQFKELFQLKADAVHVLSQRQVYAHG